MSKLGVVDFVSEGERERRTSCAAYMREFADRMERGDILDCVIVYHDGTSGKYASWGDFHDRWRMLGALENAKWDVSNN